MTSLLSPFLDTAPPEPASAVRHVAPRPRVPATRVYNAQAEAIATEVALAFGVSPALVLSPCRRRPVVRARDIAMHVARHRFGATLERLGELFGRDHTSVGDSLVRADLLLARDRGASDLVRRLLDKEAVR